MAKFYQLCRDVYSDQQFRVATQIVETTSEFFPTPAAVLKIRDEVYEQDSRNRQQQFMALPAETDGLTEEQMAENKRMMALVMQQLHGRLSMDETIRLMEQKNG